MTLDGIFANKNLEVQLVTIAIVIVSIVTKKRCGVKFNQIQNFPPYNHHEYFRKANFNYHI